MVPCEWDRIISCEGRRYWVVKKRHMDGCWNDTRIALWTTHGLSVFCRKSPILKRGKNDFPTKMRWHKSTGKNSTPEKIARNYWPSGCEKSRTGEWVVIAASVANEVNISFPWRPSSRRTRESCVLRSQRESVAMCRYTVYVPWIIIITNDTNTSYFVGIASAFLSQVFISDVTLADTEKMHSKTTAGRRWNRTAATADTQISFS